MADFLGRMGLEAYKTLLKETFEGPPECWYTEGSPGSGFFGTLDRVSVEQAAQSTPGGGAPVCAHVHHVAYYLGLANAYLRGETPQKDWTLSWNVRISGEEEWRNLLEYLRREYEELMGLLDKEVNWNDSLAKGTLGCLAHSAYHLGSLRQMIKSMGISLT